MKHFSKSVYDQPMDDLSKAIMCLKYLAREDYDPVLYEQCFQLLFVVLPSRQPQYVTIQDTQVTSIPIYLIAFNSAGWSLAALGKFSRLVNAPEDFLDAVNRSFNWKIDHYPPEL